MREKIYFLPGLMTDERLWKRVQPFLEKEFELVYLKIPMTSDFEKINQILYKQIEDENINLVGFSLGGYIATNFTLAYPNKVKRLFNLASTPSGSSSFDNKRREQKIKDVEQKGFEPLTTKKAKSLVEEKNQDDEDLINTIKDMFYELGSDNFKIQLQCTLNRVDLFDKLIKLDKPIYFFYSSDDRLLTKESVKRLESENHKMKIVSREGTSHNISLEEPILLSKKLKEWMRL
ncbi:MAG: alpha/beta fold hydrolase [Campylobacterota bacterium]